MSKPIGRDEQMYCTGAVFLAQGKMIYRDFSYAAQMPYHPLLHAALFRMFNTTHYLLVGRIVSSLCDILVMVCIIGIYRQVFKSFTMTGTLLALAAVVLYVFNPLVDYANGYAWNHDIVILCVVLSFWLFISTEFKQKSTAEGGHDQNPASLGWRIATIGALLTFATCMRITTALVELLFFVMLLSQPAKSIKQRFKTALPFLIASAFVLIWPVWVIAQAPRAFFLNLVKIPMLYGQWLHEIGMVRNKFTLTLICFITPGYFALILLTLFLWIAMAIKRRELAIQNKSRRVGFSLPRRSWWGKPHPTILAALLPTAFFIIAFIPPTMWRQYLATPVPFLVISLAFPLFYLRKFTDKAKVGKHFRIAAALIVVCVLVTVICYPVVFYRTPIVLVPERWVPIELHQISEDIAEKTKEPKQILTLTPLLALEGGCDIYTELSCGSIIYRIADSLSPGDRRITHTAGPKTIEELLETKPPSAVILGAEMKILEEPLFRAVVNSDWKREYYKSGLTVYTVYFKQ